MATATAALRTPEDLANRYDRLTKSTGRTKTFYMTEALAAEIGRLEYEYGLMNYPGSVWLSRQRRGARSRVRGRREKSSVRRRTPR